MTDYASWVAAGGWDAEVPPNIPQKVWESLGKQKYRIERQYRQNGRAWSSFIREIPDGVKNRLCDDVAQWTRDYSDHMGTTETVKNLVAMNYCLYIPLNLSKERKIEELPSRKNDVFSFIVQCKSISLVVRTLVANIMGEYEVDEPRAVEILNWFNSVYLDSNKVKELISFALHTNVFNIRHSKTYVKQPRTREGGTIKLRSSNANKAEKAFATLK